MRKCINSPWKNSFTFEFVSFLKRNINHDLTDRELIEEFRQTGHDRYLGDLFLRYIELIYGVCLKYLDGEASGKDATMEIFEILRDKLKKHEVENFKSWLYTVTKNHCLQKIRSQKQSIQPLENPEFMHSRPFLHHDDEFEISETHEELYDCLENLPGGQRESITWFYFEKKSYEEIAMLLQVDRDQVRSHIQNGRRNLKNCLNGKKHGKP